MWLCRLIPWRCFPQCLGSSPIHGLTSAGLSTSPSLAGVSLHARLQPSRIAFRSSDPTSRPLCVMFPLPKAFFSYLFIRPIWRWLGGKKKKPRGIRGVKERKPGGREGRRGNPKPRVPAPTASWVACGLDACSPLQSSPSADIQSIPDFTFNVPSLFWTVWAPDTKRSLEIRLEMASKVITSYLIFRGSQSAVPRPAPPAPPGNYLEMQSIGPLKLLYQKF